MATLDADDGSCSDNISVDSDVAFAFVDFAGVDFGDSNGGGGGAKRVAQDAPRAKDASDLCNTPETRSNQKVPVKCRDAMRPQSIEMPDGQRLKEREAHDPQLFEAQTRRVQNLCNWYELGVRPAMSPTPSPSLNDAAHRGKDDDLFASDVDDLQKLLLRSIEAQDDLNSNLPPHPRGEYEDCLGVRTSTIAGAGKGLFACKPIPKGAIVCHYTGYRHHYQSQKRLKDRAYVLKLQNGWPKHDRRNDGFVDALPTKDKLARFINDARNDERCNVKFEHIQQPDIWHCPVVAQRDIQEGEELFISYGPRYWSESRMIGG
ncbi:hypothetical protein ACHAXT_007092 [Thalassiosira profunda]